MIMDVPEVPTIEKRLKNTGLDKKNIGHTSRHVQSQDKTEMHFFVRWSHFLTLAINKNEVLH